VELYVHSPNTSLWHGALLSAGTTVHLLYLKLYGLYEQDDFPVHVLGFFSLVLCSEWLWHLLYSGDQRILFFSQGQPECNADSVSHSNFEVKNVQNFTYIHCMVLGAGIPLPLYDLKLLQQLNLRKSSWAITVSDCQKKPTFWELSLSPSDDLLWWGQRLFPR
jgi:hypothetical protein